MTRAYFNGLPVLESGRGQCADCKTTVVRVLVEESGARAWHAAEIGNYGYIPHYCGPTDAPPLRKAA